jgi:hypothetical protein
LLNQTVMLCCAKAGAAVRNKPEAAVAKTSARVPLVIKTSSSLMIVFLETTSFYLSVQ